MDVKLDRRTFISFLSAIGVASALPKIPAIGKTTTPIAPDAALATPRDIVLDFYRGNAGSNLARIHSMDILEIFPATTKSGLRIVATADKTMQFDTVAARDRSLNQILFWIDRPAAVARGDTLEINVSMH